MSIPLKGKLVDVGLKAVLERLLAEPGIAFLRLRGDSVDLRLIHVGRGKYVLNDYTRKVKERLGERLVREGFLERQVLLSQLEKLELDGVRLDFSGHVPNAQLESVVMNQTLDSIDRLVLFPMLDYEIGEQTSVYRGAQISGSAVLKRLAWLEDALEIFLKWRKHLDQDSVTMLPSGRGLSTENAHIERALGARLGFDGLQAALHEPLANIACRLESLAQEGMIHVGAANAPVWLQVPSNLSRALAGVLATALLGGIVFLALPHLKPVDSWVDLVERTQGVMRRVSTRRYVEFEVERYQERFGHYPSSDELKAVVVTVTDRGLNQPFVAEYHYIGMQNDFVVLTPMTENDGELPRDTKD